MNINSLKYLTILAVCIYFLSGCSPAYNRPEINQPIPTSYKYKDSVWKVATPKDSIDRANWWALFDDTNLNKLMDKLNANNQNIAKAAANYREARAKANIARASFFPTISGDAKTTRSGTENAGFRSNYSAGIDAKWELNLWETLPKFESATESSIADAARYASIKLSIQAELAQNYFQLRALDEQLKLYTNTLEAYEIALKLTKSQYNNGLVSAIDVASAEAQLEAAKAQKEDIARQRALVENVIAVLVGELPSNFYLDQDSFNRYIPNIEQSIPSELLERRPDVAEAERLVMKSNEDIGVARSAWFPSFSITASRGLSSSTWLAAPLTIWSLGPQALLSIFEGGRRVAENDAAQARYESAVANYKQTVLDAFKDVEDSLATIRYLEQQSDSQYEAIAASNTALKLSLSQYAGGLTTYLQVVNAQTTLLSNERTAIQTDAQRLIATVTLIKALGGGWDIKAIEELDIKNLPQEGKL